MVLCECAESPDALESIERSGSGAIGWAVAPATEIAGRQANARAR